MSALMPPLRGTVVYPESDGEPMADNTLQFQWIVVIQGNLDLLFDSNPDVFVAGNNLIYPVQGSNTTCQAPDVYVAFGRPKSHRGSYRVWEEGGIFPQVIFEVLSRGNRAGEMLRKFAFYQLHGAEEYYVYNPYSNTLEGYVRRDDRLDDVPDVDGWTSPRLGVRFSLADDTLAITYPDGRPFLTFVELGKRADAADRRADAERQRADAERQRADAERQRADAERQRAEAFRAKLRELGVDPDTV